MVSGTKYVAKRQWTKFGTLSAMLMSTTVTLGQLLQGCYPLFFERGYRLLMLEEDSEMMYSCGDSQLFVCHSCVTGK
jgi:hypothetical protein